ncbi:50S ribosomal protein L7/L12 [Candidatus Uhrbacteria bacterium]|nr:50S ribosomal protein L7/L12 [Candidatus Uhrbacteria bacterium]
MSEEKSTSVPEKFQDLVAKIEKLSVLELSELVKILEEKFGVSATPVVAAVASSGAPAAEAVEEQTSFTVELTESGATKINVIKAVRELTQLGLKEAKDLVDGAPKIVKEGATKDEAANMKKKLEDAGGKVTLK